MPSGNDDNATAAGLSGKKQQKGKKKQSDPTDAEKLVATMTEHSREVMERLEAFTDCTVQTADGITLQLQKASLAEHSKVLGCVRHADDQGSTIPACITLYVAHMCRSIYVHADTTHHATCTCVVAKLNLLMVGYYTYTVGFTICGSM
jgi:hypothetical protein